MKDVGVGVGLRCAVRGMSQVGDSVNEHLQSLKEGKYQASGITEVNVVLSGDALQAALQAYYSRGCLTEP